MIEFVDISGNKQALDETSHFNVAYNADCMEFLKNCPDKAFDLCVVDPPYGSCLQNVNVERESKKNQSLNGFLKKEAGLVASLTKTKSITRTVGTWSKKYQMGTGAIFDHDITHWDIAPPAEYFDELARVSKEQIIWGGNYFGLPPTRCFIVWRKSNIPESFSMAMCEYAWTSFNQNAKMFSCVSNETKSNPRFHPTQKPIALYDWIFSHYAKAGDKILDTHLGSGASRIAAYNAGLDFAGLEIDKQYFEKSIEYFEAKTTQQKI